MELYLDWFPGEILVHILFSTSSTSDLLHFSSTCHRLRDLYISRRLELLAHAAEADYGPLQDAIQLVTHNASQPAHMTRSAPLSFALLKEVTHVGRVAKRWEEIYPLKKWKQNYEQRRLLTNTERWHFRQALYRLWLYARAFHNAEHSRYNRLQTSHMHERARLLHNWSTAELAEVVDVHRVLRDVLANNVCPSNGTVSRKFRKLFPDTNYQLMFNMSFRSRRPDQPMGPDSDFYSVQTHVQNEKTYSKFVPTRFHEPGDEGWGDDLSHYYTVNDMLKLDPEQILWLRDNASSKCEVETYVKSIGEWFDNNGETFGQTLEHVLRERGICAMEFSGSIDAGETGIIAEEVHSL